ncbi:MAG: hypothetical protein K6F08_01245 [bacterium]|nr:hypothetical protein [bacterium]
MENEENKPVINLDLKRVFIPEVLYCPEVFNADGSVDEIAYVAVPVMAYLIGEHLNYLSDGKIDIEYSVVPFWTQEDLRIVSYKCNEDGICTNAYENVTDYFDRYEDCERYCKNEINMDIIIKYLSNLPNRSNNYLQHANDRMEKLQKGALELAQSQNKSIIELLKSMKYESYDKSM